MYQQWRSHRNRGKGEGEQYHGEKVPIYLMFILRYSMKPPSIATKEFKEDWVQLLLEESYLNEHDTQFGKKCTHCCGMNENNSLAFYRCTEYFASTPMCQKCIVSMHCSNPLHRIEKWTGSHVEKESLKNIGFIFYLGHSNQPCRNSSSIVTTPIVHTNGIQDVALSYCGCDSLPEERQPRPLQLLGAGLYPATFKHTSTAFSVAILKQFHHISTQGELMAHDFVASLRWLTNYGFPDDSKNRYREFMMAYRQHSFFRNLHWSHKHADEDLPEGSLVMDCPACPQPNMNMTPNWRRCATCARSPCHARHLVPLPLVLVVTSVPGTMPDLATWFSLVVSWMPEVVPRVWHRMPHAKKPASCTICYTGWMDLPLGSCNVRLCIKSTIVPVLYPRFSISSSSYICFLDIQLDCP